MCLRLKICIAPGVGDGQGGLQAVLQSVGPQSQTRLSSWTELISPEHQIENKTKESSLAQSLLKAF